MYYLPYLLYCEIKHAHFKIINEDKVVDPIVKKINENLKNIKRTIRSQFNINEPTMRQLGNTIEIQYKISVLLYDIHDYLNKNKENPSVDTYLQLLKDVDHLIRLYQIIGGNIAQESHESPININQVLFSLFKTMDMLKEKTIFKAAKRLREKLSIYCDPKNTVKQKSAPPNIQINLNPRAGNDYGYKQIDGKNGGAHSAGPYGGIYEYKANDAQEFGHKMLLKRETYKNKPCYGKIIAEFVGGAIIKLLAQEQAAKIVLLRIDDPNNSNPSENVYIGSQFFNDYTDLYKFAYWLHHQPEPEDRPKFAGSWNYGPIQKTVLRCVKKSEFATVTCAMLVANMFDMHSANIGFDGGQLVCLDFASSLYHLHKKIHPNSHLRLLPGFGPTNHFREYPRAMRITYDIADALDKAAEQDYTPIIKESLGKVREFYVNDIEPIKQFATHLGVHKVNKESTDGYYESAKNKLILRMEARKASLAEFALQIRIDLCIEKQNRKYQVNKEKLKKLVKSKPEYFKQRLQDGNYHFRLREHKSCYLARLFGLRITENKFAKKLNRAIEELKLDEETKKKLLPSQEPTKSCFPNLCFNIKNILGRVGLFKKPVVLAEALAKDGLGLPQMINDLPGVRELLP